jgi:hypothetical protein
VAKDLMVLLGEEDRVDVTEFKSKGGYMEEVLL